MQTASTIKNKKNGINNPKRCCIAKSCSVNIVDLNNSMKIPIFKNIIVRYAAPI